MQKERPLWSERFLYQSAAYDILILTYMLFVRNSDILLQEVEK